MIDYQDGIRLQNQDLLIRVRHWQRITLDQRCMSAQSKQSIVSVIHAESRRFPSAFCPL